MPWPSIVDYNAAFANPGTNLLPESLSGAKTRPGPLGTPMPLSGGFALIYEVVLPDGTRKAVRCFNEDDPARRVRAAGACGQLKATIAAFPDLRRHFAGTDWEEDGIRAGGRIVPAMVMDWVKGQTLGQYLEARHSDALSIAALRENLCALVRELERHGVVHGDLQTGNIVVTERGDAILLDYDGLSFAGHETGPELESGHVNFQHPSWNASSPGALKDRFPAMAMDLGLAALAERPELFARFSTGENILFTRDDFYDPDGSAAFGALRGIPALARAAVLFAGLCQGPIEILPGLDEFRSEAFRKKPAEQAPAIPEAPGLEQPPGAPGSKPARKAARREKGPYAGPYAVLDGTDFAGIGAAVGRKIEVVGKVVSVKADGITKYGLPYVFVNFGDWRHDGFKLAIWSEGLDTFVEDPDESWEGRWVSAVGLVDEPYHGKKTTATQLSITILDSSQLRFITEAEARYRLGGSSPRKPEGTVLHDEPGSPGATRTAGAPPVAGNAALLAGLGTPGRDARSRQTGVSGKTTNAELLSRLSPPGGNQPTAPSRGSSPSPIDMKVPSKEGPPDSSGCLTAIVWGIIAFIVFTTLTGH
ncbi:MAG: AarF/UbiB family protein [Spirochaetes bacterium]|nr:AarF/UbiB family protein [Spirochaetota bacterium]